MRALISTAAVTGLAFALVATTANATPTIQFGQGAKLPGECTASGGNTPDRATGFAMPAPSRTPTSTRSPTPPG